MRMTGHRGWEWTLVWGVLLLPFLVVWGLLPVVFAGRPAWVPAVLRPRGDACRPMALFFFSAVVGLLCLYPSADFAHFLMALPLFLPLLAAVASRTWPATGWLPVAAATAVTAVLCAPFVSLLALGLRMPLSAEGFARASGIRGGGAEFDDAAALVRHLDAMPERSLLVLVNEPLVYFLSGRDSVLAREEFLLHLVGFGLIRPDEARAYVPEPMIIERLQAARPTIVDAAGGATPFAEVFPDVARYLATHYRPVRDIGRYRVLAWAG
jgi:hypothetical protein